MEEFKFTREERVRLLAELLPAIFALKPTKYPPSKDGSQKHGSVEHVAAVWANKLVNAAESVWQAQLDYEDKKGAHAPTSEGGERDSPF